MILRKLISMRAKRHYRRQNQATRDRLAEQGGNPAHVHEIVNVFHTSNKVTAEKLKLELKWRGFTTGVESKEHIENGDHVYAVRATARLVPDLDSLNDMTDRCVEIARAFRSRYQGWFADSSNDT